MSYLGLVSEYRYISYKTTRITINNIDLIDFVMSTTEVVRFRLRKAAKKVAREVDVSSQSEQRRESGHRVTSRETRRD